MKDYLWGIAGTIVALLSLGIQLVKEIKVNRREKRVKEREEQETLSLKVCNQVEYYNGVYRIKFINTSFIAAAYNLKVSIRIKNRHFNYVYKLPDFSTQEVVISTYQENDKALCEIYINVNAMNIDKREIEKQAPPEIIKQYEKRKLELKDLLKDNENYLAIRYNAVNSANGKTIEFPKQVFRYEDIVHGKFGIGHDYVTPLE